MSTKFLPQTSTFAQFIKEKNPESQIQPEKSLLSVITENIIAIPNEVRIHERKLRKDCKL